jgi:hypothetical protein
MESAVSGVSLPASFAWPLFIFWVCERLDSESLQQAGAKTWRPPTTQPGHRHVASRRRAAGTRVRKTGGNRSGSTGSRWNRSGPVHEPVRFPPKNRAYKFAIPVNRPVFADSRKPLPGGFVNPGFDSLSWLVIWSIWCKRNRRVHDRAVLMLVTLAHLIVVEARRWVSAGFRGIALLLGSVT